MITIICTLSLAFFTICLPLNIKSKIIEVRIKTNVMLIVETKYALAILIFNLDICGNLIFIMVIMSSFLFVAKLLQI